jgi:hypothetical protein
MRGSTTTDMIVVSQYSHATQLSLGRGDSNFRDNTYNKDSYLDEADMSS